MLKTILLLLIVLLSSVSAWADGPAATDKDNAKQLEADSERGPHYVSRPDGGSFVKKPEVVLSTVGPVPVGIVPQAATLPGAGGLNVNDLNVLVAPPGLLNRNNGIERNGDN